MTTFNQEGQTIHGTQTNIGGDVGQVNVGAGNDQAALLAELERLKAELAKAGQRGEIDQELATDADYQVSKALNQARQPKPDRSRFLDHLNRAQDLLKTVTAGAGLVTALGKLAEMAQEVL